MVIGNLSDGWEWTTIGTIAKINGRDIAIRDLSDDLHVTFVPMSAVDAQQGIIAEPQERPLKEVRKGFTPFSDGDVLLAKITPSMENGKAAIARNLKNGRGFGSTEFHVFRPKEVVLAEWIFHFIRQESFRRDAKANFSGTAGQLRVPSDFLVDYPIPLPPLSEQEKIVSRIEELFSDLDAGVAALERVRIGLKRYKTSVLKAACEGKLLENREAEDGELPEGWRWVRVEELAKVGTGATPLRSEAKYWNGGKIPWITSGALNELAVHEAKEFITELAVKETNAKVFSAGALLVAMYGEGKTRGKVSELMIDAATNQACAALVFTGEMVEHKPYVKLFFEKNYEDIRLLSSGGVQPNLNLSIIKNTRIPLPPLDEQRRIVAEVERRLSVVGEVESAVEVGLVRAGRLRQSVLRSAFEGML